MILHYSAIFLQKAKIFIHLQHFQVGSGIWIWAVDNLVSSHYASVVRELTDHQTNKIGVLRHSILEGLRILTFDYHLHFYCFKD